MRLPAKITYMSKFIDLVHIKIQAGRGGDGKVAWRREKYEPYGGPYGGDGGRGGSVWLEATNSLNTLLDFRFKHEFEAANGANGESARRSGKSAEDLIIKVPVGTVVYRIDQENDEESLIGDLNRNGQKLLVARGGRGGRGNQHFANSVRQAPHFCEPGEAGTKTKLKLELKLVAHIGIIGLPNAGKSTLISRLSTCKAKTGDYPFTTITPNLGIVKLHDNKSLTIADIPGLIEGAAEGKGLGFHFLRHIERTKVLIHLLDSLDQNVVQNYQVVRKELAAYNPEILQKQEIIALNKIDALDEEEKIKIKIKQIFPEAIYISAVTGEGLEQLKQILSQIQPDEIKEFETQDNEENIKNNDNFNLKFDSQKGFYKIESPVVEGLVRVTDFKNKESVEHLFKQLKKVNIFEELENCGIKTGDTVLIGNREMIWSDFADEKLI